MKRSLPAALIATTIFIAATAQSPVYRLDSNEQSLQLIDCEYASDDEYDMGRKNTIASNIAWHKYATDGNDSLVSMVALKFRDSFPVNDAVEIVATINGDTIRNGRFLSDNDTARLFMLFFPASEREVADTFSLSHPSLGNLTFPPVNFLPHGVYSTELRRTLPDSIQHNQ